MDFDNNQPIYLQIVEYFYENILSKKWIADARIPSVREVAMSVEVNPNTAIRAFNYLQDKGVIYNKRGIGYFVSKEGYMKVLEVKRKEFLEKSLPEVFKQMMLLKIDFEEIQNAFNNTKNNNHEKK